MTAMTGIRNLLVSFFFGIRLFIYLSMQVLGKEKVTSCSQGTVSMCVYWLLDEFCQCFYCLLVFMHKSMTCFQNGHKFWNLAVSFQKHSSLHAESIKGSDIWWDSSQGFWTVCINTAKNVSARGKRGVGGHWHSFLCLWDLQPGTRRKSEVSCGTCPQHTSAWVGWIPFLGVTQSSLWHTCPLGSWCHHATLTPPLISDAFGALDKSMS